MLLEDISRRGEQHRDDGWPTEVSIKRITVVEQDPALKVVCYRTSLQRIQEVGCCDVVRALKPCAHETTQCE